MRLIPDKNGFGGAQRAWYLLEALQDFGPIDFVLVRPQDDDMAKKGEAQLSQIRGLVRSVTSVPLPEWLPSIARPPSARKLEMIFRLGSGEALPVSATVLKRVADRLPVRTADALFACRLSSALLARDLIRHRHVEVRRSLVDLDDVLSEVRVLQYRRRALYKRPMLWWDSRQLERAERRVIDGFDEISVSNAGDAAKLAGRYGKTPIHHVANIIDRDLLPPRPPGPPALVFVGSLFYEPNIHGLRTFLDGAWPLIRAQMPEAEFRIVGMSPVPAVTEMARQHGVPLHANVASVIPYYENADVAISPIFVGSGTRIKLLESMAFGRANVSTTFGAQGLGVTPGETIVLADTMPAFADAVVALLRDPARRTRIEASARAFVEREFGLDAMRKAIRTMYGHPAGSPRMALASGTP